MFDATGSAMYIVSYRVLGNQSDVEEAMQEAFIRMMKNVERIKNLPCPERAPYCVIVVKNISKNMRRAQRQHVCIDDFAPLPVDDAYSSPEQEFFARFDSDYLERTIDNLDILDQEIILMRWGKMMKYREIGAVLGISEEAATKRGQRALKRLRERYFEEFDQ